MIYIYRHTQNTLLGIQPCGSSGLFPATSSREMPCGERKCTQPWKIRDHTSAGSQRLALSGLASRLHAIYTYTFPPHNAAAAAEELIRLYVHKGHDPTARRRFLRKRVRCHRLTHLRRLRLSVCVNPCSKGCCLPLSFSFASRGLECASDVSSQRRRICRTVI